MFPGIWRHGDWIKITSRGSAVIYGRSDSTINRGGVRMGTSEIYSAVEGTPEVLDSLVVDVDERMLLFVVLREGAELDDELRATIRRRVREYCSPRHMPDSIEAIAEVPRTLSNKKLEVPVKKILLGADPEHARRAATRSPIRRRSTGSPSGRPRSALAERAEPPRAPGPTSSSSRAISSRQNASAALSASSSSRREAEPRSSRQLIVIAGDAGRACGVAVARDPVHERRGAATCSALSRAQPHQLRMGAQRRAARPRGGCSAATRRRPRRGSARPCARDRARPGGAHEGAHPLGERLLRAGQQDVHAEQLAARRARRAAARARRRTRCRSRPAHAAHRHVEEQRERHDQRDGRHELDDAQPGPVDAGEPRRGSRRARARATRRRAASGPIAVERGGARRRGGRARRGRCPVCDEQQRAGGAAVTPRDDVLRGAPPQQAARRRRACRWRRAA